MKSLLHFLRGTVRIRAQAPAPERLLNLCAREGVVFWSLEWREPTELSFIIHYSCLKRLKKLEKAANCTIIVESEEGLPPFLLKFRRRYGFLLGLALSLLAVGVLSRFVLTVEITGNEQVPTAVIASELRRRGVRPGAWGPSLNRRQIAQEAVRQLDGLSWMAINRSGTRLEVSVREVRKPPETIDEGKYCDIVSEADGLVLHVQAELGDPAVKAGSTVIKDDLLIAGMVTMEPPQYSDLPPRYYLTHARGRVWARTWRTVTAAIPLSVSRKEYTGEEWKTLSLEFAGRRIEIFGNSSISDPLCDKISYVRRWELPVVLRTETHRPYRLRKSEIDRAEARKLLERELRRRVEALIGESGTVEKFRCTAEEETGLLKVTAEAQCLEEIGREVPGSGTVPDLSGAH